MICPTCGNQIVDNSIYCIHCGSTFVNQPQYSQAYAYQPSYQAPANDYAASENYNNARRFIEMASSMLGPAIVAFILANYVVFIGNIYAIVKRKQIKKKTAELPFVDESLLDPVTYKEYKTAKGKVTAARRFSKLGYALSAILFILLAILAVELIVLAILITVGVLSI